MSIGKKIYRGEIINFIENPLINQTDALIHFPDGILVIEDGIIVECEDASNSMYIDEAVKLDGIIVPGFIDTHVHFPQLAVLASPANQLLEWLNKYTFTEEAKFADEDYAKQEANKFIKQLLLAGTTTALVFATTHKTSAHELFKVASEYNLRLATGKVLSDINVPSNLQDTPQSAYDDSKELINQWHQQNRLSYAVTPRFAVTSSKEQLKVAGTLLQEHDDIILHTHLSENHQEIAEVAKLHPYASDYLDVYELANLLTDHSVFAHSIHLDDKQWSKIAQANAAVSHCPCSNLFLGSGLFSYKSAVKNKVKVSLGSDVGGGTSLSMFKVMDEAYKVSQMDQGNLDALQLWYLATLGGARALNLDQYIGNFAKGKEADFIVIDPTQNYLLENRLSYTTTIEEKLFALAILGDERIIKDVYIMGEKINLS